MKISAQLLNTEDNQQVMLKTNDKAHSIDIPPRISGRGSSANGGEMLFLALATCYCNDIYREASRRSIAVEAVEVEVEGNFDAEGACATNVVYHARVTGQGSAEAIRELMYFTDTVAEIQNTLRTAVPVTLGRIEVVAGG